MLFVHSSADAENEKYTLVKIDMFQGFPSSYETKYLPTHTPLASHADKLRCEQSLGDWHPDVGRREVNSF